VKLYITIQSQEFPDGQNVFGPNIFKLDGVDTSSCDEIVAKDILDNIDIEYREQVLANIVSKLRHRGRLTLTGVEAKYVSKSYVLNMLSTSQLNELLYNGRLSTSSIQDVVNFLENHGLKVTTKRIMNYQWLVIGERP